MHIVFLLIKIYYIMNLLKKHGFIMAAFRVLAFRGISFLIFGT